MVYGLKKYPWTHGNTIITTKSSKLKAALFSYEVLCQENCDMIISALAKHGSANFLDLLLETRLDNFHLENLLEDLCQARIVRNVDNVYDTHYRLNLRRLNKLRRVAKMLTVNP